MKKIILTISVLVMALSCAKETSAPEMNEGAVKSISEFSANIVEDNTKTVMSGKTMSWESADKLLVFGDKGNNNSLEGTGHAAFLYTVKGNSISDDGKSAIFVADEPVTTTSTVLALYPYPVTPYTYWKNSELDGKDNEGAYVNGYNNGSVGDANGRGFRQYIPTEQHYVSDGVASGLIPMVAFANVSESSEAPELKFNYGAGVVRLNLTSTKGEKVKSIRLNTTFTGSTEFCTGSFYFYEKQVMADCETHYGVTGNSNRFSYADLVCDEPVVLGDEPTSFNFVVSGRKYSSLSFDITYDDGSTYTLVKGTSATVKKGHIYSLPTVNVEDFDKTTSVVVDGSSTITIDKLSSAEVAKSIKVVSADGAAVPVATVAVVAAKVKQCESPVSVDFSEVRIDTGEQDNVTMPTVFAGNSGLGAISLPSNVTVLPSGCFRDCVNLKSVKMDDELLKTDGVVFWNDKENVGTIDLPKKFKTYGSCGMAWCEAFTFSNGNDNGFSAVDGVMFQNGTLMQYPKFKEGSSYTIPDGTKAIYANAFYANPYLTEIKLSKDVATVSYAAFHGSRVLNVIDLTAYGPDGAAPVAFKSGNPGANAGANVGAAAADRKIILPASDEHNSAESIIAKYAAAGWSVLIDGKDEYDRAYGWNFWIDGKKVDSSTLSSVISELSGKEADWKF